MPAAQLGLEGLAGEAVLVGTLGDATVGAVQDGGGRKLSPPGIAAEPSGAISTE